MVLDKKCSFVFLALIIVLFSGPVKAEEIDYSEITSYESLIIDVGIAGEVISDIATKLTATLHLYPAGDGQEILEIESAANPQAGISDKKDGVAYDWDSVKNAEFSLRAKVKTKVSPLIGSIKSPFPSSINSLAENLEYTKPSENIDSDNAEIIKKANEIVGGKTDTLKAVSAIAEFVNSNVEYDESYANTIKKASFVLQNKIGVCDEYTNLFIALCRALGIPARYISGVAYSNTKKNFGNHAWAEVYIPEYGWVPFDATYNQHGWVDATHVALAKTIDTRTSIVYSYQSNANINAEPLSIKADIISAGSRLEPKTEVNLRLLRNNVKARSYVPLEIEVKNLQQAYIPLSIYITKSPGVYGKNSREVILSPDETKKIFFIIDTKDEAREGYAYEAKVEAKTQYGNEESILLLFSKSYTDQILLSDALSIVNALTKEDDEYSYDVSLKCMANDTEFYADEEIKAGCDIKNNGNVLLKELNLCVDDDCRKFDLPIGGEKSESFELSKDKINYIIGLDNDVVSKSEYLGINILQKPDLRVVGLSHNSIRYDEGNLTLTVETKSVCRNLTININSLSIKTDEISLKKDFDVPATGKNLLGEKARVRAECYDLRGNKYEDRKTFDIKVTDVPPYAKIWRFILKMFEPVFSIIQ